MNTENIIKLATSKKQKSKDFGVKTDTEESAKAYLDIFHNINNRTMTIRNVTIGDKFIDSSHIKSKRISTVVDFIEKRSLVSGNIIGHECISSHEFMGQTMKNSVPFVTVLRNKIKE